MIFFRFAQPWWLFGALIGLVVATLARRYWYRPVTVRYALTTQLKRNGHGRRHWYSTLFYLLRLISLVVMALLLGKPQLVDSRSKIEVNGIDIVLSLDASGSMFQIRDAGEGRSRFEVAQAEAIRFIEKRDRDALGLVIFGEDAVSRAPVTFDKKMVKDMIRNIKMGDVSPHGTVVSRSIVTAANRLKHSKAKSKIMILLTDGAPSEHDMDPETAVELARKLGIRVYTVGFGADRDEPLFIPGQGLAILPRVNTELLHYIAQKTGGKFFMARNAQQMRSIYDTIDQLERTEHEVPLFTNYTDLFIPGVLLILFCALAEILLSTFVWFGL